MIGHVYRLLLVENSGGCARLGRADSESKDSAGVRAGADSADVARRGRGPCRGRGDDSDSEVTSQVSQPGLRPLPGREALSSPGLSPAAGGQTPSLPAGDLRVIQHWPRQRLGLKLSPCFKPESQCAAAAGGPD